MRTIHNTIFYLLALTLVLLGPGEAFAGGGSIDASGNLRLNVHFRFVPTAGDITTVQDQLRRSSRMLCDATEGAVRISDVLLSAGGASEPAGDIWYFPPGALARSGSSGGPVQNDGNRISLTYGSIRADVLTHELGHLVLGLGDQYDEQRRFGGPCGIGRSFDPGTTDEQNHTIMQQSGYQQCQTAGGVNTGASCLRNADCNAGETCPLSPLMSEFSVAANFDLLRGDSVLAVDTCPVPRPGDTLDIRRSLYSAASITALDTTDFETAAATAAGVRNVEFVDSIGLIPAFGEESSIPISIFTEHTAAQAWTLHFGADDGRFDSGTADDLRILDTIDLTFTVPGELATVDGTAITAPGFSNPTLSITNLDNGAADGTLEVVFDVAGGDRIRERTGSVGTFLSGSMISAGGVQQLGDCTSTKACEKKWNTSTDRWEASAVTIGYLNADLTPLSDWEKMVENFNAWYPLALSVPAGLPAPASPASCANAGNVNFDVQVSGADQIFLVIDRSYSMRKDRANFGDVRSRLDWAKAGARAFADLQAGSGVEVGFLSFATTPTTELALRPIEADAAATATDHALTPFKDRIDDLEPGGNTAIGDTLESARTQLNAASVADPTLQQAVFLLTDGEQTAGALDPQDVAEAMRDDGIQIFAVPLGSMADSEFLSRMASETGGAMFESDDGLELPTLYAELYARFRGETPVLPRTASAVRGQGPIIFSNVDGGASSSSGHELPDEEVFVIPVETDADKLNVILSTRNDLAGTWNPAFQLLGPAGEVVTHSSPGVIGDAYYRILRVANPSAGDWQLTIRAQTPDVQRSYLLGHVENPLPDCYAGITPGSVVDGTRPVEIAAGSFLGGPLGTGVEYSATVRRPTGSLVGVSMAINDSLNGATGFFDSFIGRGRYEVVVQCRATESARYSPGEHATPEDLLNGPKPDPFVRQARTSFFLDTDDLPPLDGDGDDDGIPDGIEGLIDTDGDGLPDAYDEDSDGDEVPDSQEGDGDPTRDTDGDGIVDFRDPDSNNNGVTDGLDPDPYSVDDPGSRGSRFHYSFHVGSAHPLGRLDKVADSNVYVQTDVGYRLLDRVDLVGRLGFAQFTEETFTGLDHRNWLHLNLNAQWSVPTATGLRWYLQAGPGWYHPKTGSNEVGFNMGFGGQIPINGPFSLEFGADYHRIQTDGATEFFTLQLGVLFR